MWCRLTSHAGDKYAGMHGVAVWSTWASIDKRVGLNAAAGFAWPLREHQLRVQQYWYGRAAMQRQQCFCFGPNMAKLWQM
jgi:hypothetical protein